MLATRSALLGLTLFVSSPPLAAQTWSQRRIGDLFNQPIADVCNPPANFTIPEAGMLSPERRQSHLFFVHDGKGYAYGGKTDCGISNPHWKTAYFLL